MAKDVSIRGVSYPAPPSVHIPRTDGTGDAVFYDTSDNDVTATEVLAGTKFTGANGPGVGTLTVPTITQNPETRVLTIS